MPKNSFAFCGSPDFASTILEGLIKKNWIPKFVVTETDKPVGRKKIITPTSVKRFALANNLSVFTPANKQELTDLFKANPVDLVIVVAYGKIIPASALELCPLGWINVHASLLPKYRGASPIQASILAGDTQTGITIMKMDEGLDTGPIIAFVSQLISSNATAETLSAELATLGADALPEIIDLYISGAITPKPQDNSLATTTTLISKQDGEVAFSMSASELDKRFRAYQPWPGIFTMEFGRRLLIKRAHLKDNDFVIESLGFEGKKAISGNEWIRANQELLTKLPSYVKFI